MVDTERFSKLAAHALERSLHIAEELGHTYLGSEHLLYGLLKESDGVASRLLISKGITADKLRRKLCERIGSGCPSLLSVGDMTPRLEEIITKGGSLAHRFGFSVVGTDHLLMALCETPDAVGYKLLFELKCEPKKLHLALRERMGLADLPLQTEKAKKGGAKNLQKFAIDLTKECLLGKNHPLIGREEELSALMRILVRQNKNNPCLIGEAGVGKTVIVEGLAARIAAGQVPAALRDIQIHMLDLTALIAGTKYRGEFEERLRSLLEEVEKDPNLVLFIDEMHLLAGAGAAEGAIDAANILKPALARGRIKVIGATTLEEYRRHIEKDSALERRFAPIRVEEPSEEQTMEILKGVRPTLEEHHGVMIPDETLSAAIRLSVRFLNDRFLPDKAIDLIDEAGARQQLLTYAAQGGARRAKILEKQQELDQLLRRREFSTLLNVRDELEQLKALEEPASSEREVLSPHSIAAMVQEKTGIPISDQEPQGDALAFRLSETLEKELIGQQEGIRAITSAILRSRAGLSDPKRPSCTLLFCGPTGVGKTRLCKLLAKALFGKEDALIKIDMGEYMEPHSIARLIGSPPGYIGHEKGGGLVNKIRNHPYSVVLFDEIEKAHRDVLNLLLGILDEGRLTDGEGRCADFRNCLIVLTSNLGSERAAEEPLGFGNFSGKDAEKTIRAAITKALRPEFLNRLDEIIVFHPLDREALLEIARLQLLSLQERLGTLGYSIEFSEDVALWAVERGYDRRYGARSIIRAVEKDISNALAEQLLKGELTDGLITAAALHRFNIDETHKIH